MPAAPLPEPSRGVFETLLVARGAPIELDTHLARLRVSIAELYGAPLPDGAEALVGEAADGIELGRLRLSATPRPGAAAVDLDAVAVAIDAEIVCPPWERGLDLRTFAVPDWRGGHKWADRRLLEALEAEAGAATPLLVDGGGAPLETTRANLFAVGADGVVATPPADGRILPGVARARAIEAARAAGAEVAERALGPSDLVAAREAFATGSIRCVEPVRSLDGAPVGAPGGELTAAVAAALRERWLGAPAAG